MRTAALVFDLDDTLFPECEFVRSGFYAVDGWLQDQRAVAGFAAEAQRLFAEGARGRIFDEALRRLGVEGAAQLISPMVTVYRTHAPQLALYPDAKWAIEHFRGRFKLGLITDGYAQTQRNKVASLGIGGGFDAVVFTDDLGRAHWKPSPEPYRRMMAALGCPGPDCVYVGDNPAKDFVAANRLGWLTVQLTREDGEYGRVAADALPADHQAAHVIKSLHDLTEILS